jgi:hypothetical protein
VAAGVEKDRDLIVPYPLDRLRGRFGADIDEMVEYACKARASRASIVRPKGIPEDLEMRAIVPFDDLGQQIRQRVGTKVGSQVGNTQPPRGEPHDLTLIVIECGSPGCGSMKCRPRAVARQRIRRDGESAG